jgi:hypothetical protein
VEAISGTSPIAVTPEVLRWVSSAVGPTLSQASTSGTGANMTLAPQASTGGTSGSAIVTLASPGGGSTEAAFQVNRTGGASMAFKSDASGNAFLSLNGGTMMQTQVGRAGMYLGGGLSSSGIFIYPQAVVTGAFYGTGNVQLLAGSTADFGGGTYVLGIGAANTKPTALPSTHGDVVLYGSTGTGSQNLLGIDTQGIEPDGPAIGAGNTWTLQPSAITTASAAGVNLAIFGGAPGSGGTPGGVTIQSSDHTGIMATASGTATIQATNTITIDSVGGSGNINIAGSTTGATTVGSTSGGNVNLYGSAVAIHDATGGAEVETTGGNAYVIGSTSIHIDPNSPGPTPITVGGQTTSTINVGNAGADAMLLNTGSTLGLTAGGTTTLKQGLTATASLDTSTVALHSAVIGGTNSANSQNYFAFGSTQGNVYLPSLRTRLLGAPLRRWSIPASPSRLVLQLRTGLLFVARSGTLGP